MFLAEPGCAQVKLMGSQQHVLDAGLGGLMIFDPIIPLFPVKVNGNQGRGCLDELGIMGQFLGADEHEPPGLVVEAGRRPDARADDFLQQTALHGLFGKLPAAPPLSDRFLNRLFHREAEDEDLQRIVPVQGLYQNRSDLRDKFAEVEHLAEVCRLAGSRKQLSVVASMADEEAQKAAEPVSDCAEIGRACFKTGIFCFEIGDGYLKVEKVYFEIYFLDKKIGKMYEEIEKIYFLADRACLNAERKAEEEAATDVSNGIEALKNPLMLAGFGLFSFAAFSVFSQKDTAEPLQAQLRIDW